MSRLYSATSGSGAGAHEHTADWLFRGIGACAVLAFASLWWQVPGLVGTEGILPFNDFLEAVGWHYGTARFWSLPTLLWLSQTNAALHAVCVLGTAASLAMVIGRLRLTSALVAYASYLSLLNVGQVFTSFQWDILLVECLLAAAVLARAPTIGIWVFRLLLFRFMFLSGFVKLASGDPTWADGSALSYHFETQPLPTVLAWYAHRLPAALLEAGVWATLVIELVLPFCILLGRRLRLFAGAWFVLLEVLILLTGSYNFFNLLTIVLCFSLLDDDLLPRRGRGIAQSGRRLFATGCGIALMIAGVVTTISAVAQRPPGVLAQALAPWRAVNRYGLFAVMTTERRELTIEGSLDGVEWRAYGFPFKPGDPAVAPRLATPHQPRLDWQMWFAALGEPRHAPWVYDLTAALLQAKPAVLAQLDDPFDGQRPAFIRVTSRPYTFTDSAERAADGNWWRTGSGEIWLEPRRLRIPRITHSPLTLD